ncbi:MAG TPA: TolC family protein [Gillisia sp.]|nr:TolC family protein [Gillisia sp.]
MKKLSIIITILLSFSVNAQQSLSLEECYSLADTNYPIARQTELLKNKTDLEISVLEKGRLPKVDLNAQATYQSEVIQLPQLPNSSVEPLNKDQYRATLDVNQLIYNGGSIDAGSKLKMAELEAQKQMVAVNLYQLKNRINQSYFSVLLLQEQKNLLVLKQEQLQSQIDEVKTGVKYGAILPASENVLEAENLKVSQQLSQVNFDQKKAINNLSALINKELSQDVILSKPKFPFLFTGNFSRPELQYFDLQNKQIESSKEVISISNLPEVYGFAQAGYGNPGLNMLDNSFQDFYMIGLKANWNVFDWGRNKAQKQALSVSQEIVDTEKETFQLNNEMQLKEAGYEISKIEALIEADNEIVILRDKVLKSATSQLKNGVITSSEYLTEFNNLYESKIGQKLHEIQLDLAKANYKVIKGETNNK